ncbi:MAG: potassium channel family protein [Verrucomicrobiota bacterium]
MSVLPKAADSTIHLPYSARSRSWFHRYPVACFLVALVLALGSAPFGEQLGEGDLLAFMAGPVSSHTMKGFTGLYFSFITLSTVGYGDIVPISGMARMLAMMEAMAGTFYVAILISRLVAVYSSRGPSADASEAANSDHSEPTTNHDHENR